MGTISDKLTYLNTTKTKLKDMINYGLDNNSKITNQTTFRNYANSIFNAFIEALKDPNALFNNLPKVIGSGTNIILDDTAECPMKLTLNATELEQTSDPTPSSPQDIHTISGDNTIKVGNKNLFTGDYSQFDNKGGTGTTYAYFKLPDDNKQYTLSAIAKNDFTTSGTTYLGITTAGGVGTGNTYWVISAVLGTITQGTVLSVTSNSSARFVSMYSKSATTLQEFMDNFYIQLEEGTSRTDYVEHKEQDYTITLGDIEYCKIGNYKDEFIHRQSAGKNLFDNFKVQSVSNATIVITPTGFNMTRTNSGSTDVFGASLQVEDLKPNTKYTFNFNVETTATVGNWFVFAYKDRLFGTALTKDGYVQTGNNLKWNITTDETGVILFGFYTNSASYNKVYTITNIQLEEGSTATNFEPYGDGKWYLKKNIGKVVLDGTQTIPLTNWRASETSVGWVYAYNVFNNQYVASSVIGSVMSNKLTARKFDDLFQKNVDYGIAVYTNTDYGIAIRMGDTTLTTSTAINNYLSSNPIIVYYVLATPTYILLNSTLQTELNNIEKALSYQGQTNINQVNNDLGFTINSTAIYDLNKLVARVSELE